MCEQRKLSRKKIREAEVEVAVDTGAVMVLSPRELEEQFVLSRLERVIVRLANEERIELEKAGGCQLTIGDRQMSAGVKSKR